MKILVIGSGGREHALAWKIAQSERIQTVYVAPGNGGTALDGHLHNVPITDPLALVEFAKKEHVALTVVGPETPLAGGIVNIFREHGLKIFGPDGSPVAGPYYYDHNIQYSNIAIDSNGNGWLFDANYNTANGTVDVISPAEIGSNNAEPGTNCM